MFGVVGEQWVLKTECFADQTHNGKNISRAQSGSVLTQSKPIEESGHIFGVFVISSFFFCSCILDLMIYIRCIIDSTVIFGFYIVF